MAEADLIVRAARVHTFTRPALAEAVAVQGDRVLAAGTFRSLRRQFASAKTRLLDLRPAVLLPAFTDSHIHLAAWALARQQPDLSSVATLQRALQILRRHADRLRAAGEGPERWLVGRGFSPDRLGGFPTASDLDAAVPDRPAAIFSQDGHSVWLNSLALLRYRIGPHTPDPPSGRILRDHNGRPTGILQEAALDLLPREDLQPPPLALDRAILQAIRALHRRGITAVHSVDDRTAFSAFQRLRRAGQLNLRIAWAVPQKLLAAMEEADICGGLGDEYLHIAAVKIFVDGALGSRTAWIDRPYPGTRSYRGVPVLAGRALEEVIARACRLHLPCWIHAIGNRAVAEAVRAISQTTAGCPCPLPHRIEHAQCVRPGDIARMARLDIVASIQPRHLTFDAPAAERHWPDLLEQVHPWRQMLRAGVRMVFGSDAPVAPPEPAAALVAAVGRCDMHGNPPGGWRPEQRISVRRALMAHICQPPRSLARQMPTGQIRRNFLADMAAFTPDPVESDLEGLKDLRCVATIFAGRVVWLAGQTRR